MIQLYFLSILFSGLTGYILVSSGDDALPFSGDTEDDVRFPLHNDTFRLVLGLLTSITGLLMLFLPISKDISVAVPGTFIVGDLVPAVVSIAAGFSLIWGFYRDKATLKGGRLEKMGETLLKYKRWLGFIVIAVTALHFIFPQAPLL
jgi:hypothetical protein